MRPAPAPGPRPGRLHPAGEGICRVCEHKRVTAGSFPRRKLGPGYRAAEVDEFIARIEATLSGSARPGQTITAADVQAVKFKVTRHAGYDEQTMDVILDHYADELDKLTPSPPATVPGH